MAKKKTSTPKTETAARIARTDAYAERVRMLFAATVNQILALNKSVPKLEPGVMFSFDAQSAKMQKEVERLLRQLHSVATMAIQNGIRLEWGLANQATDSLLKSIIGKKAMSDPTFNAWTARNTAAMNAFISRSEKGLKLSDRVWSSVLQLREEMEVAITVAVGEGKSAQKMSQDVRQYLNDPDLMFRRFRYKDPETGEWRRKWKKRIKTPDGTYKWIDYDRDSYRTGAGVYKSSAKNAMRVARTETNIAYRRADNARWQEMDFVIGQRIQLSGDHPKKDICDKLAGDYPKNFLFDGWHPQCFCYVTPITIPPEETAHLTEMMLNGEDWRSELKRLKKGREITSYPESFKSWVRNNADNINAARARGTLPYFISNNQSAIDKIINPNVEPRIDKQTPNKQPVEQTKSIIDRAKERHAARTQEQIDAIKNAWKERATISRLMPNELKPKSDYLNGEEYIFDKKFFDLIDKKKPIKLEIVKSNSGSYSSYNGDTVHIASSTRNEKSKWHTKSVIYHEYGHCIDAQRDLWLDEKLIELRNSQIKTLKKKNEYVIYTRKWNKDNGGWYYERTKKEMSMVKYIDTKLEQLTEKIFSMKSETFTSRGITKNDVIEQICSTRDTIKSLITKYGAGHSNEYFKKTRTKETEYLAHAFENAFLGNRVFEKYMPEIYKEMVDYIKSLK